MKKFISTQAAKFSKEAWVLLCLTILSCFVLFKFVNLEPRVDNNFFFSDRDPQFHNENLIAHLFVRRDTLLIVSATGPIQSKEYLQKVDNLTEEFLKLEGITGVKSISHGPKNLDDAMQSPLWKRLLISKDEQSTNIIVLLQDSYTRTTIPKIEKIVKQYSSPDFHVLMSGIPYIIELISRYLVRDIKIFSLLALLIFGSVIWLIFRSRGILLGTIITCINASMLTLMISNLLNIKIGLLTANLATIVFVLTLSHIIFLTYNWKYAYLHGDRANPVDEAIHVTFPPSFWSMLTALLGFTSLLGVPAQPLKELGASGIAGSLVALAVAYGIYPAFLRLVAPVMAKNNALDRFEENVSRFLEQKKSLLIKAILVACLLAVPGLWRMNTDPSFISYFGKGSEIEKGLTYIDRNGGSSPLVLIIKTTNREKLNTDGSYHQLWELQKALEKHPAVGTIVSLPVLMSEARRQPLASFISWEWLFNILQEPKYDAIAKSFITEDRLNGLFLLRMNELNRTLPRVKVIQEIKKIVEDQGFTIHLIGGIYNLQGHLAKLVARSVLFGLVELIAIFSLIAWIISRSLRIAMAITLSICAVPIIVLGTIGWLRIPLDIISAPATNIALGLGIDSMIHMVRGYRRQKAKNIANEDTWQIVRNRFWQPVLTFTLVIILGFGIFLFSEFPSTQRFGIAVVFGTIIAALTSLFIMPSLAQKNPGNLRNSNPQN